MREVPASYRPRSNLLPSKSEKTLWKKGSRLGNSTIDPAGTTRMCGSKLLFFCTSRGFCAGLAGGLPWRTRRRHSSFASRSRHRRQPHHRARNRSLPRLPARAGDLDAAVHQRCRGYCVVACACNPTAPAHNIATQIRIVLWLIVERSSSMAHLSFLMWLSCRATRINRLKKELPSSD
jgi:hypothetical protein